MAITKKFLEDHGITDEATVNAILQENDSAVSAHTAALTALQQRYDTDTADLRGQLETQAYDHAAEKFFDGFKFSSQAARKSAMADFKAKGIKYADGKFDGAEAFMDELKKSDPDAFAKEAEGGAGAGSGAGGAGSNGGTGGGAGTPFFSSGGTGSGGGQEANPFEGLFGFSNVN